MASVAVSADHIGPSMPRQGQTVSASDLVRNFGTWQDRAITEPVYILKRGRPRLVMLATELIAQLGTSNSGFDPWSAERAAVLDGVREVVILLDSQRRIRFANSAARGYFDPDGPPVAGGRLDTLLPPALADYLDSVAGRAMAGRLREHIEVAIDGNPRRHLSILALPLPDGVCLVGQDVSMQTELNHAHGALSAVDAALAVLSDVAKVRINLRGYLVRPTESFAGLSRLPLDSLATIRFVSLIDIGTRVAVADAIERVLIERQPRRLDARLLVNGEGPRTVAIGLSPLLRGVAIEGVQAVIIAR